MQAFLISALLTALNISSSCALLSRSYFRDSRLSHSAMMKGRNALSAVRTAKSYYAVARGSQTGIFTSWEECARSVSGYPDNKVAFFIMMTRK